MIDRETVVEFLEMRKYLLLGVASAALLVIALILGLILFSGDPQKKENAARAAEMKKNAFGVKDLFLPVEPLAVPGVQLSREPKDRWSDDDAKRWYTVPDAASMDRLRLAGQSKIDALLESVP